MKKFRFTLEKLYRYKESILEREKLALAALRAQQAKLRDTIEALSQDRNSFSRQILVLIEEGTTSAEVRTLQYQVENIVYQLEMLNQELAKLDREVEAQLNIVIELTKEKTSLEMLRDKQLEEFRVEEAKENEIIISEFVSGRIISKARLANNLQ